MTIPGYDEAEIKARCATRNAPLCCGGGSGRGHRPEVVLRGHCPHGSHPWSWLAVRPWCRGGMWPASCVVVTCGPPLYPPLLCPPLLCPPLLCPPAPAPPAVQARTYPKVERIPCWQTCWETMQTNASAPHGVTPSCLEHDAPAPVAGAAAGPSCARREVHCTPGCTAAYGGPLKDFWSEWEVQRSRDMAALDIQCPCGNGG